MILQGSFPGGQPHSSVLLNNRTDYLSCAGSSLVAQTLLRHPNTMIIQLKMNEFNRDCFTWQTFKNNNANIKTYPINLARINLQGEGEPLDDDVLQMYEDIFEADLSDVIIHEGDGEAEAAGALAFTAGNHIYFADGRYNPHSSAGRKLLGHELTHVIQQKEGRVKNPLGSAPAFIYDPILEAEAERIGNYSVLITSGGNFFGSLIQMSEYHYEENEKVKELERKRRKKLKKEEKEGEKEKEKEEEEEEEEQEKYKHKSPKKKKKERKKSQTIRRKWGTVRSACEHVKQTIVDILQAAYANEGLGSNDNILDKLGTILRTAQKNTKRSRNSNSSSTFGLGYSSTTGNIYPVGCSEETVGEIKNILKESKEFDHDKVQDNEGRETMHVEPFLMNEHRDIDYIYTTQAACIFCYGYMCLHPKVKHLPLRDHNFPHMWKHPDENIFLDTPNSERKDKKSLGSINIKFNGQNHNYKIRKKN
jgi:hypothetical protein